MSIDAIRELGTLASVCPELNMANYTEDDVRHLNDWAIEMSLLVERYTLSRQPTTAIACGIPGMAKTTCPYCEHGFAFEHEQPATGEPVARSEREQLRHAQAAVVMPMIGPLLDAWENSDREVMSQEPELSKQLKNINSAMEDADTHPATGVPDDSKRLNWLDDTNKRFRMGWEVGQAPAGNVSIRTIITGGKSIRDAIDAAMLTAAQA